MSSRGTLVAEEREFVEIDRKGRVEEREGWREDIEIHTLTVSGMRANALISRADLLSKCLSSDSSGVPSTLKMMFSWLFLFV